MLSDPRRIARRKAAQDAHARSIALMTFLSQVAKRLGVAKHVYVVGGAVRNFIIDKPIKDIDVVIDAVSLGGKDSDWFAQQVARAIPTVTNITTNQYGVAILTVKGPWVLDGNDLKGEVIEIANARKESYGGEAGKGYKPSEVVPATIEEDVYRREFSFNTLLWRLLDLEHGPEKAEVIDLTGCGLRDLENRELRCPAPPDVVFADDPTRLMRAIKFVAKYGFKIPPDLAASIRKNAPKMKQAPWEAIGKLLVENVLDEPTAPQALKLMKKLGLLDVVAEMVREQKPFAAYLAGQLTNRKVSLLLDMMELGLDAKSPISFLSSDQQRTLRLVTTPMPEGKAEEFLARLKKVPLDNMALIERFNLPARDRGVLAQRARELMLETPDLAFNPSSLQKAVERELSRTYRAASKTACGEVSGDMLPVMDPLHNLREVVKQFLLLEDHLTHPEKQCSDCINKHLMTCEALFEEAVGLDKTGFYRDACIAGAQMIRGLIDDLNDGADPTEKAQMLRQTRKMMVKLLAKLGAQVIKTAKGDGMLKDWGPTLVEAKEEIPGGLAKGKKPSDFDPKELEKGTEVEREHLEGNGYSEKELKAKAQEIAMDHLVEISDYYTRLQKMEGQAEGKKAAAKKYDHIDFKPPESVAKAAEKGLEYRQKASPSNKGGLTSEEAGKQGIGSGVQRAVNLKNRDAVSPETIGKMVGFFARHQKNKGIAAEHKDKPWNDKGYVSWLLWGGDPGKTWAEKVKGQMDKADKTATLAAWGPLTVKEEIPGKEASSRQNPFAWKTWGDDWEIRFDVGKMEPLFWNGSGFKDPKRVDPLRSSGQSEGFRTKEEAERKIRGVILGFIRDYRGHQVDLIRGWDESLRLAWGDTIEEATSLQVKKARTYNKLSMFDFDGTLFRSWEKTPNWWEGTELDKGPFSFFVRPESLGEPCVPDNPGSAFWVGGVVGHAKKAIATRSTVAVLITGRVGIHKKRVIELCKQKGLNFDHYYFNPGMSASVFKKRVLRSLLAGYNTINSVEVWENENEKTYRADLEATGEKLGRQISVRVQHVRVPPKELECGPGDFGIGSQNSPPSEARMASGVNFKLLSLIARREPYPASALSSGDREEARKLGEQGLIFWDLGRKGWIPTESGLHQLGKRAHSKQAGVTGDSTGVGFFIPLPKELAAQFPDLGPKDDSPPHITFLYVGDVKGREEEFKKATQEVLSQIEGPIKAVLNGVDTFQQQDQRVAYSRVRFSKDLGDAHQQVKKLLTEAGFEVAHSFPFLTPHVTLAYMEPHEDWEGTAPQGEWVFDGMQIWGMGEAVDFQFGLKPGAQEVQLAPAQGARKFAAQKQARLMAKRANVAMLRARWLGFER